MDDLAGSRAGVLLNRFIAEMSLRCGTEREGWSAITTTSHPPTDTRQTMTDRNGRERDRGNMRTEDVAQPVHGS